MITAGVAVNSSLLLEPAHQLTFWLDAQSSHDNNSNTKSAVPRAALKLTNISTRKLAIFKVRTNNADMFTVKPVHGVIAPGESLEIVISVVATSAARLATIAPKELATRDSERFLIQSVEQSEDMRGFDTSDLVAFWKRVPRELATNSKIGCRFMVLTSGRSHPPAAAFVMDTISKSPQPTVKQLVGIPPLLPQQEEEEEEEQKTPELEQLQLQPQHRRLSSLESRDIDKTIDIRGAHRRRRSSSSGAQVQVQAQPQVQNSKPDTFESTVSDEINLNLNLKAVVPSPLIPGLDAPSKSLFSIHPSDTVEFKVKPGTGTERAALSSAAFFLTNKSRSHALAFKVKTTNHEGYFVKPSRGLIGPSNAQRIEILPVYHEAQSSISDNNKDSAAAKLEDLRQREAKDRFMVEIVRVDIGNYQELLNLDERVRKRELVAVWDSAEPSRREKAMMSCRILDIPVAIKNNKLEPTSSNQDEHDTWC